MGGSCEEHYFLCRRGSRMCAEADQTTEQLMDRYAQKALFLGCAERGCAPLAPSSPAGNNRLPAAQAGGDGGAQPAQNSAACARALLQLYLHVNDRSTGGAVGLPAAGASSSALPSAGGGNAARRRPSLAAASALAALRARAASGAPALDASCADAWARSNGGQRPPSFRPCNASGCGG